ncbi:MAG: hypothetical protein JRI23_19360 [Deltaproteobacteria bacterium]|nr:hypothetical protein [Deltaproteobacteria bacterium]MBW2534023.1 hypothetical protein [Deltaproteobacteria bacterium]
MLLRKPRKRKSFRPKIKVGCAFCWQWLPEAKPVRGYVLDRTWGGRCECGALFVVDASGRLGGQAVLDLTTMACDGDGERALRLESGVHYQLETKPIAERVPRRGRARGPVGGEPTVWFLKVIAPLP